MGGDAGASQAANAVTQLAGAAFVLELRGCHGAQQLQSGLGCLLRLMVVGAGEEGCMSLRDSVAVVIWA